MTAWLKLFWQLLTAMCLELWGIGLRIWLQAYCGCRRRKLRQRAWEALLAGGGPFRESGDRVRLGVRHARPRRGRGKRTAMLVGAWMSLSIISFLNVWVLMTMVLVVCVPVWWLTWRVCLSFAYSQALRASALDVEAGDLQ